MAYHLHYTIEFDSWITEDIRIELFKKDEEAEEVTNLKCVNFKHTYPKGEGNKMDGIIASEISFTIRIRITDSLEFYDLLVTYFDEWKVIAYSDEQVIFVGFLTPGEGGADFQNKPLDLSLNAVDGLGLLKGVELTSINGDDFESINLIKDYFAAIFSKTGCDIPIRMFSSWIEESGTGRLTNPTKDTFNQYGLHKRTFLNDKVDFFDCYECLRRLCADTLSAYQWNGMWVVRNIGEMQANAGPMLWYTDYDSSGNITGSGQLAEQPCAVGHDLIISPRDRSQYIGSDLPIKSAKHIFNYVPPPELVNNQDLSRLGAIIAPLGGVSHRAYQLVGWTHHQGELSSIAAYAGSKNAYIRIEIDAFGNEVFRYYRIEGDSALSNTLQNYIRNDNNDFWVSVNDRMDVSLTYRADSVSVTNQNLMIVALLRDGQPGTSASDWYTLDENGAWVNNDTTVCVDQSGTIPGRWVTRDIECDPFPEDGNVYFCLGTGAGSVIFDYKAINITYKPYFSDPLRTFAITNFAGLGVNIVPFVVTNPHDTAPKGDYWFTEQDVNILDKKEQEAYLSDANRKSIKGALFRGVTSVLTTTTWHRDNVSEERHFKELVNISRYNHAYRRMWKTRGLFTGLKWQPANDTTIFEPLSFHRHFFFPDKSALGGKYFMLVPPLTINHDSGTFDGTFVECLDVGLVEGVSGVTPEAVANQLADLINATTALEWDSEGNAPPGGTAWFPPTATAVGATLIITLNSADTPIGSANHGGVGNSPSLTMSTNLVIGAKRITSFVVGSDVQPGNTFTISIYDHEVIFTSTSVTAYQDGNQLGDRHQYQISFK